MTLGAKKANYYHHLIQSY